MATQVLPADWWLAYLRSVRGGPTESVAATLADRAAWVGRRLADGQALGIPQNEEGLTEAVLLDMCKALPDLLVRPVGSKTEEGRVGHDWEWWIEGPTRWFGARVQAKVMHGQPGRETYALGYRVGRKIPGFDQKRQVDVLHDAARAVGLPALYALYNPSAAAAPTDPGCPVGAPTGAEGVTFVSAPTARWLVDKQAAETGTQAIDVPVGNVAPHALPWSCLAACGVHCPRSAAGMAAAPPVTDPATAASDFARTLMALSQAVFARADDRQGQLFAALGQVQGGGVFAAPPGYVDVMLQDAERDRNLADSAQTDPLRALDGELFEPGLAPSHVIILRRTR